MESNTEVEYYSLESTRNANAAFLFVFFFFFKCNLLPIEVSEVCGIVMKRRNSCILFYTFPTLVPPCALTYHLLILLATAWTNGIDVKLHTYPLEECSSCILSEPTVNEAYLKH